jgi:5-methylcytosine-specific restriction endonuclease McrA
MSGSHLKGRTYEEIYGPEKAAEMKRVRVESRQRSQADRYGKKLEDLYSPEEAERRRQHLIEMSHKSNDSRKGKTLEEIYGDEKAQWMKSRSPANKKGHTYEQLYGSEKARQIKEKLRPSRIRHHTVETRRKMSKARFDYWDRRGRIGEDRDERQFEYSIWRTACFQRDHYTCQRCEQVGGHLECHHVKFWKYYPESRFDVDNGMTLCKKCHVIIHMMIRQLTGRKTW